MNIAGHEGLKHHLNGIKENSEAYRRGGAKLPHVNMNLYPGNGQTAVSEFCTFFLYDYNLRAFHGSDKMKEYRLDGSLDNLKRMVEDIKSNAVYTNEFEGVIAIDYSALADYANEYQVDYFLEQLERISRDATLILYYDDRLGKPIESIKESVIKAVSNCIDISVLPYSLREYSQIVTSNLLERGINVECSNSMEQMLCKIIESYSVTTAKEAANVAEQLVTLADYSELAPKLDSKTLSKHYGIGIRVA